jgi:hypothetical protein
LIASAGGGLIADATYTIAGTVGTMAEDGPAIRVAPTAALCGD